MRKLHRERYGSARLDPELVEPSQFTNGIMESITGNTKLRHFVNPATEHVLVMEAA